MVKVLYLADGLANGGAERQLALLIKYLPAVWEPRVWSLGGGPFAQVLKNLGVQVDVHQRTWRYDMVPILDLWRTVLRWRPAIVHSWGWVCSAAVGPLCRLLRIPWIDGSIRIGWVPREHVLRARFALALSDRVIANSQAGLDAWRIPASKGRVVYNGFEPDRLPLTKRRKPAGGPFTVVMVGRMSPAKDFDSFIRAARLVTERDNASAWRFLAIGTGPQRAALMESVADLVAKGLLAFPDAGLEVLQYVRNADVGVLMTHPAYLQEGCSNAILEYMACGLPVVCSDSGGNRELVINGKTGFVIPPLDAEALAERLRYLRSRPDVATEMGEAGRERVFQEFTVQAMVQKTIAVYEELLKRGGAQNNDARTAS